MKFKIAIISYNYDAYEKFLSLKNEIEKYNFIDVLGDSRNYTVDILADKYFNNINDIKIRIDNSIKHIGLIYFSIDNNTVRTIRDIIDPQLIILVGNYTEYDIINYRINRSSCIITNDNLNDVFDHIILHIRKRRFLFDYDNSFFHQKYVEYYGWDSKYRLYKNNPYYNAINYKENKLICYVKFNQPLKIKDKNKRKYNCDFFINAELQIHDKNIKNKFNKNILDYYDTSDDEMIVKEEDTYLIRMKIIDDYSMVDDGIIFFENYKIFSYSDYETSTNIKPKIHKIEDLMIPNTTAIRLGECIISGPPNIIIDYYDAPDESKTKLLIKFGDEIININSEEEFEKYTSHSCTTMSIDKGVFTFDGGINGAYNLDHTKKISPTSYDLWNDFLDNDFDYTKIIPEKNRYKQWPIILHVIE